MASVPAQEDKSSQKRCPICSKPGNQGMLVLRQINAEEAVYVCENPDCCYPVGFEVNLVKRPVAALNEKQEDASTELKEEDTTKSLDNTTVSPQLFKSSQPDIQVQVSSMDMQQSFYENNPWNSDFDSLLDPEVVAYLDSVQ